MDFRFGALATTRDQVAPESVERQIIPAAPTATARPPFSETPLSDCGGCAAAVQVSPPSELLRTASPTATPCSPSSANLMERSAAVVPLDTADQLAPPSVERSSTPRSPAAQAWTR